MRSFIGELYLNGCGLNIPGLAVLKIYVFFFILKKCYVKRYQILLSPSSLFSEVSQGEANIYLHEKNSRSHNVLQTAFKTGFMYQNSVLLF